MPDLRSLAAPLRVTWDVPADPALALALMEKLAQARVLFVEAQVGEDSAPSLAGALARGVPAGMRVSALGSPEALRRFAAALAPEILARIDALVRGEGDLPEGFRSVTAALFTTSGDAERLAALWGAVRSREEIKISFLNPPAPAEPLTPRDRERAAGLGIAPGRVTVHDLFLSEAMGCDPFEKYAGCAAGETLAHLTPEGVLVACRTLPVELGDLRRASLRELWAGAARGVFRESLTVPTSCRPCALADVCRGGCPGLAGDDGRDASCLGPRAARKV